MTNTFLITEKAPDFFIKDLKKLGFNVDIKPGITSNELSTLIQNYTGLVVRGKVKITQDLLQKTDNLKYILRPGSGLDIINVKAALEKNITLINSPEGNRDSVAEHTIGMLLSLLNNIPQSFEDLKNFRWTRKESTGTELKGKNIGIIGYGNMGKAFAQKLKGFDVKILAYDKHKTGFSDEFVKEIQLNELHQNADIISFHIPLNKENYNLVDKEYLEKFKKPIYLVNTSRGQILNINGLITLIEEGKIKGACLDVLENENFKNYSQSEKKNLDKLIKTQKTIITPHVAGWTTESLEKIYSVLIDKLKKAIMPIKAE